MPQYEISDPQGKVYTITAPDGVTPDQVLAYAKNSFSKAQPASDPGVLKSAYRGVEQGATFGLADEAKAGIASLTALAGKKLYGLSDDDFKDDQGRSPYEQALSDFRQQDADAAQSHPIANAIGNIAGAVLTGSEAAKGLSAVAPEASEGIATYAKANPVKAGLALGAAQGGVYGFDTGQGGLGDRAQNAVVGALGGAAGGGAGGYVASKGADALDSLLNLRAASKAIKSGEVSQGDTLATAEQKVQGKLLKDSPNGQIDFNKMLQDYAGNDKTLLETGGANTQKLADTANLFPSAAPIMSDGINQRAADSVSRMAQSFSDNVSSSFDADQTLSDIMEKGRAKAAPLYDQAYAANQSIKSPLIDKILDTPEGKSALSEASQNVNNEIALKPGSDPDLEGISNQLAQPQGGLKLKTLDYVKRAMDQTINKAYRAGDEGQAARIVSLKNGLLGEMKSNDATAVNGEPGAYAQALKTSGDYFSNRDALQAGQDVFKPQTTPQQVQKQLAAMGPTEQDAYRSGISSAAIGRIGNTTDGRNVTTFLNTPAIRQKLTAALTPNGYAKLMDTVATENKIAQIKNTVMGNSKTAARSIAAEDEFGNPVIEMAHDLSQHGDIKKFGISKATVFVRKYVAGLSDQGASDVAKILVETDPQKKLQIVQRLSQTAENRDNLVAASAARQKLQTYFDLTDKLRQARLTASSAATQTGDQK